MYLGALVGMTEQEFWNSTPRYLDARRKAYEKNQQYGWEQARFISFYVVKTVDAKNKIKNEQDLAMFPWDEKPKESELKPLTDAEWDKIDEEMDAALKVLNPKVYEEYMAGKAAKQLNK